MRKSSNGVSKIRSSKIPGYGQDWRAKSESFKSELGRKCCMCGTTGNTNNRLNSHHMSERDRGGPDSLANIVILCDDCHTKAHPKNRGMRAKQIKKWRTV